MNIFKAAAGGFMFGGGVKMEEPLPALSWRTGVWIKKQIRFGGEAQQGSANDFLCGGAASRGVPVARLRPWLERRGTRHFPSRILVQENQLGHEQRVGEVRKWIRETLRAVDAAKFGEVVIVVRADAHKRDCDSGLVIDDASKGRSLCYASLGMPISGSALRVCRAESFVSPRDLCLLCVSVVDLLPCASHETRDTGHKSQKCRLKNAGARGDAESVAAFHRALR
jgi:hypothetical protein